MEKLFDRISEERAWRIKELLWIKSTSKVPDSVQQYALRAGIPIAYAHFEGAVKNISFFYLVYVFGINHKFCDLTDNFIAIGLSKDFNNLSDTKKVSKFTGFIKDFDAKIIQNSYTPDDEIIDTGSNVNKKIFQEICSTIGLDDSKYEVKYTLLDEVILNLRNKIAHGERLVEEPLDEERFLEVCDTVIWFINNFGDDVFDLAYEKKYLRKHADTSFVFNNFRINCNA